MDKAKCEERAFSRFEKVLRVYWDGIPVPPFCEDGEALRNTFSVRQLAYSADYYGETSEISLDPEESDDRGFRVLSSLEGPTTSLSSRIGSHYSPLVGTFRYRESETHTKSSSRQGASGPRCAEKKTVRIPLEPCEGPDDFDDDIRWTYRKYLRMTKVVELYEPLVKESAPINRESLRRIVVRATRGLNLGSKEWVVRETCCISDEYTRWITESIYYYMSINAVFRRILAPLQLKERPDRTKFSIIAPSPDERAISRALFETAKKNIEGSLMWSKETGSYFTALKVCWDARFRRIALFDLTTSSWTVDAGHFLRQIVTSMRAAFTRIRIDFYTNVEDFFFGYISNSKDVLSMDEAKLEASPFYRIFTATRMFLVNHLRTIVFDGLDLLIAFFSCNNRRGQRISRTTASKHPVLSVDLVVGENYQPRCPGFARIQFGVSELFEDLTRIVNELPRAETVVLRTLNLRNESINAVTPVELACARAALMDILDEVSSTIDELAYRYSKFSTLPVQFIAVARSGNLDDVKYHVEFIRASIREIRRVSPDIVYCGCFAINCQAVKKQFCANWESFLSRFVEELHNAAHLAITIAEEKCTRTQEVLQRVPTTVGELEEYLAEVIAATDLTEAVRTEDCQKAIAMINCMEENQIPVDNHLFFSSMTLMRWPEVLKKEVQNAEEVKRRCHPLLLAQLNALRAETRQHVKTLGTGVTELYNMFNLEICDIAAQTCDELRELVDQITHAVESIAHQEKALNVPVVDKFDDLYTLMNYFDTIEQFWTTVYRATTLREYYSSPVSSLNATKMIDNVREWRRLIHCSTRSLRSFSPLVRLGKQQELALANFECLEDLLRLITTPGLRKNHWKEIVRLLSSKLNEDVVVSAGDLTLQKLLDGGILDIMKDLSRIAYLAKSDFDAETALEEMKSTAKKTYFQMVTVNDEPVSRLIIADSCRTAILVKTEEFIRGCRQIRKKTGVSALVMKMLNEWESASEKTLDTFSETKLIEDQWGTMHTYLGSLHKVSKSGQLRSEEQIIMEKLDRAAEAYNSLNIMLSKPQSSLYMAIVQESMWELLLIVKTAMDEVRGLLGDVLEQKRVAFPRFNFLTDAQLLTFLSASNTKSFIRLLPYMYSRITNVEIDKGFVVAYSGEDGASIRMHTPVEITDQFSEKWMQTFDREVSRSLFVEMRRCYEKFSQVDLDDWVLNSCTQLTNMGLRLVHTRDMVDAIRLAGVPGLTAYRSKINSIRAELSRIMQEAELSHSDKARLSSAITYVLHTEIEVRHAIGNNITSLEELNSTVMLHTEMTDTTIMVRMLSMSFEYGFEFLGNYSFSYFTSETVEKLIATFIKGMVGRTTPIVCGDSAKESVLRFLSILFGRYIMHVECYSGLTESILRPLVRGSIEVGTILCLDGCEELQDTVRESLAGILNQANEALLREKRTPYVTLPLGPEGTPISVTVSRRFQAVLSTERKQIPHSLLLDYRPIYIPQLDYGEVIRGSLCAFGITAPTSTQSVQFAALYQQFNELDPRTFSNRGLMDVLRNVKPTDGAHVMERLCDSFVKVFLSVLQQNERLLELFRWHIENTLTLSDAEHTKMMLEEKVNLKSKMNLQDAFTRFSELASASSCCIITGPPFSGKTRLWKRYVGEKKHTVIATSLVSASEFYGVGTTPGTISRIAMRTSVTEKYFLIVEDDENTQSSLSMGWPVSSRIPGIAQHFIIGPAFCVIVAARRLHRATPRLAGQFTVFSLSTKPDWRKFLKSNLRGTTCSEVVARIIELLLPVMMERLRESGSSASVSGPASNDEVELYAAGSRCVSFYRKWQEYTQSCFVNGDEDEMSGQITEKTFSAQCGVFAVTWAMGLSLAPPDRFLVMKALRDVEKDFLDLMDSCAVTERVLPPLGSEATNILDLVSTPLGWKSFAEAAEHGINMSWSKYTSINSQSSAWTQIFPMASRASALCAIECLLDCGQSVTVSGLMGSGKSTLLQTLRQCDRWATYLVSTNKGLDTTNIQDGMARCLSRRSDGRYAPPVGRKLVVCIDDLHLSPPVEKDLPLAGRLIAFCEKYAAINTLSLGYIPTTDIVFLGSTLPMKYSRSMASSCMDVYLPLLDGDELLSGLSQIFDAACARKRVELFPNACASFISLTHCCFIKILAGVKALDLGPLSEENSNPMTASSGKPEDFLSHRFLVALRAADFARQHMLTAAADYQVAVYTFKAVNDLYQSLLMTEAPRFVKQLREGVVRAAEECLRSCVRDEVRFDSLMNDYSEVLSDKIISADRDRVSEWIMEFEVTVDEMREDVLETMLDKKTATKNQSSLTVDTVSRANRSMLVHYSHFSSMNAPTSRAQTPIMRRTSSRLSTGNKRVRTASLNAKSGIQTRRYVSPTYQTTWLTMHSLFIYNSVQVAECHLALIGASRFGYHRLLRLVCSATRIPLALLREYRSDYTFETFKKEMRSIITFFWQNDTRVVVYVPSGLLTIAGIARQVDILIRTGDVSELFTVEELLRLVKGYQMPQLRSLRPLTLGDDAEIRRRVRRCLSFVLQVPDEVSLKRLSIDYPAVSSMTTVVMHSPETHATMLKDLSMSVVCEDEDEQPEPSFHISSTKTKLRASEVAYLVWQVYSMVARERETSVEQLIAFAGLVKKLREIRLDAMQHYARTSSILKTRGDEVVKEMNRERDEMVRTSEALEVAKERIALLLTRHQKEQDDHEQFTAEIKKQEESMKKASNTIAQWEAKIKDNQARADHALNVTIQKLRKVKTTQIRSFATTRLPEKGMLFLKALYRVLGDELPRHDKSSELWSLSMKWICRPDFVEKLAALSPQRVVDAETLLCFQQELSEVRFGSVMPYAHVISEFMLSFMECVRLRRVENLQEWAELDATKTKHLELINQAVTMYQQAENFEVKAAKTKKSIAELEKKCKDMNDTIYNLSESQRRLNRYVGLVDRFARFIHNDEHPDKCMNALSSEGDILLVASFYTLTAMDTECEALYRKLQGLLNQHGVPSTDPPEDAFKPLIFLGHGPLVDAFVCPEIPRRHRLGIYALMRRISTRWMLFGGACSNYENLLVEFLNFECTGSAILSAIDPDVKDQIIACLKNGEGVLLRDVNDQPEIDLVRLLCPLLEKLNAYREKPDNKTKISYDIFGREVEVHPKFFLICTSKALVTRETTAAQWLDVMNLFTPMERKYRFEALLLQTTPPEVKGAVEDMKNKRERLYEEMLAFIDAHRTAVDLLCLDIADIARGADNELNALETALTDVDNHDGQLLQITMHIQALRKQQLDAWSPVEATLHHSADVLRLIEKQKLCRSFDDRILDVFIGNMATLSPELQARLMPQQFSELPLDQKYFYGLVNYIDRVVRCFLAGWPYPLRGLFSLLFFAGTVHDCEEIRSKRGELFPESVELLNGAQYKALRTVLSDRGDLSISSLNSQPEASSTLTFFILKTYESSSDPLLKFIAADSQSMDFAVDARDRQLYANLIHQGSHIEQLFRSLAELDLAKVEESAAALFTSFFYAVKSTRAQGFDTDSPKSVGGSAPSTPSRSCSLTPTSVSSEQHLTNLAFADVFPEDLLTEASQYCMPLYYRSVFPSTTLKELRRRASGMKWGFQWFHIGSVEDVTHLARRMTQCFYSKPGDRKGMLLVAYADGFRFAGSPSIGSNVPRLVDLQVSEQRELARSFHRLLSLFAGGITSKVSFLGVNSTVPVCLAVVCSQESHQLLWSFPEAHSPHGLCFYSSRHFESPRQHLLDLLRSDTIIQGAKWEAAAEAKAKRLAAAHQAAMEQNETSISGSISGRKFHGSKRMIDEPSTTTVERMAVLVVKELVVIHTAMAERFLMDFQEWRYEHGDTVSIPPFGIDDDNLRNLLQILSGWITFHSEKPSADVDTSRVEVLTDHTSSDLQSHHAGGSSLLLKEQPSVFADPKATPSQDRKAHMAYLLCRNRRLAWRLHLPMSSTADGEVPSLMHIAQSVQSGSPVRGFNGGGGRAADPLASDLDNSDDEMISVLFSLFQKLSHQVFFQVEMPTTELAASEWLIDQIVVAPSATGVVSCNLTNIFPPCPLLLDAETSFKDWTMEISSNPSHLDELSCDAAAVGEHRRRMQVQVRAILFSSPTDAEAHGEVQRPSPAGTIPRELPALPSLVLEEESSRIAGDAADTQPDDPWMTSESMIAWKLEKKYVQLLINYYAVHGEWTVCHMIMRTARSLLGRNTSATASRTPAHQVALWLPCLRFPMVAGWLLAAGLRMRLLRHMRASGEPEIPSDDIDRMILVITVRRHLTPGDVVLERARLSPLLYTEVQSITGWSDDQMDSCSSSVWPGTQNRNDDEDVVVAFRAVGFPVRYAFPNPEDGPAKPSFVRMLDRKGEDDSDSSFICSPSRSYSDHEPSRAAPPLAERTVTLPSRRNPTSFMWKIPPSISYASSRGKGLQRAASTSQLKRHLPGGELGSTRRTTGKPHNDLFFTGLDVDGSVLYTDDHAPKRVSQVSTIPLPLICASKEARKEEQHPTGFVVDMSRSYGHMSFNSMRDLIPDGEASAPGSESSSRSASLQQLHAGDSTYVLHTEWRTLRELHVCLVYDAKDTSGKTPHGPDRGGTWTMGGTVNADPENREFPHKGSMGYHIYVE